MEARVGFINASPLVRACQGGRTETLGQLGGAKDEETIRDILKNSGFRCCLRAVVATRSCVGELLSDGCQIIHYVGHGDGQCLPFEFDDDRQCGIMEPLEVNALKDLFKSKHAETKLVFISSCCSEWSAQAFVDAGVPHVVAVKAGESVEDERAHLFARVFYGALLGSRRHDVQAAFDGASAAAAPTVRSAGNSMGQGGPFILLPRGGNHGVPIFDQVPRGEFIEETPPRPKVHPYLPGAREPHLGMPALQKLLWPLLRPSVACVTVVGGRGSGKTQMVIQACKYLQERSKFGAMFFAKCDKSIDRTDASPSWDREPVRGLCQLIGQALEMEPLPNSVEQLADFLCSQKEGGLPPRTVLLVLDGVDALVETPNARRRFLKFTSSLCSTNGSYTLKLLVTSNIRLQHDSCTFVSGSEQVLTVAPLEGTDPAQLFFNAVPWPLTRGELGVVQGCSHDELLKAMLGHLDEAKGHPATLVLLASKIDDIRLNSPPFKVEAISLWESFHPAPGQHPLLNDGDTRRASTQGHGPGGHGHHYAPWTQQRNPRYMPHQQQQQQEQLQRHHEYDSFTGYQQQQHGQDTASLATPKDPGCHAVWVKAIAKANENGRRHGNGDRSTAGGSIWGRADLAPLEYLSDGLRELLHQQQTSSSDHSHTEDYGYECLLGGTCDAIDATMPHGTYEEEMLFIEERLLSEQKRVVYGVMGTRARGLRQEDNRDHAISIEAFVRFSEWWAPVMTTLSRLRGDWWSTGLVRAHWFVRREAAHNMLLNTTEGTFLLRFSESIAGVLVVSFTVRAPSTPARDRMIQAPSTPARDPPSLSVRNCLVRVNEGGDLRVEFDGQCLHSYTSLHDLAVSCDCIQTLYPDIPKELAFREVPC